MWFSFTARSRPARHRTTPPPATAATPAMSTPARLYRPKIVLDQCGSVLISQSKLAIEKDRAKTKRNAADSATARRGGGGRGARAGGRGPRGRGGARGGR